MVEWRQSSSILNLGTRSWVVNFTLRPFYPQERTPTTHWIRGWVGHRSRSWRSGIEENSLHCPCRESNLGLACSLVTILTELLRCNKNVNAKLSSWATGWTIGVLGFDSRQGLGIFFFTTASRTALGPTQPPIQWVPGALSLGVKRPGREADHSPHLVPRSKNMWSYTSTPPIRLHGVVTS
jgi:hypothetical protein